jgi:IS30 family transposase
MIAVLRSQGASLRSIARQLQRNPSTISRELQRNTPPINRGYYLPHKAQARAQQRWRLSHQRPRLKSAALRQHVRARLQLGWSPELIAGRLQHQKRLPSISHEAIYQWLYTDTRELIPCLVRGHRKRLPRGHSRKHRKSHIPGRVPLTQRPAHIARRRQVGHWEIDTAVSRQGPAALAVLAERKTRFIKLQRLPRRSARAMRLAVNRTLAQYPTPLRRTLTYDNGSENSDHQDINAVLGTRSFFCAPFHSWEKGTVENSVGLVRRYFPKGTDFTALSKREIKHVERRLNNRPRKCLNYLTPAEAFRRERCT